MSSGFRGATNIDHAYERVDYSRRGEFGPREAGSVLANAPLVGLPAAAAIAAEAASVKYYPGSFPPGAASVGAWLLNMLIWFLFKVASAWLRHYGGSFLRDLGAVIWDRITDRFGRRRDRRKRRPEPDDGGDSEKRRPWLPWRRRRNIRPAGPTSERGE